MICWAPVSVYSLLPSNLRYAIEYGAADPERSQQVLTSAEGIMFMLVFPGSVLIGFLAACGLSGSAAGILDSLKRGLKSVAVLFAALMILALCAMLFGDEKGPLVAAIIFWIGIAVLLAGAVGGRCRLGYDRLNPAPAEDPSATDAAQVRDAAAISWLEAVARGLGAAGLFDHATALRFYNRRVSAGQIPESSAPPFADKYSSVRAGVQEAFPGRTGEDWAAANEDLRLAVLLAAKAEGKTPGSALPLLECQYPGFSSEFYDWVIECSRKLS